MGFDWLIGKYISTEYEVQQNDGLLLADWGIKGRVW